MRLLVAYLATPGGEDAVALGACLARTLHASLDISLVIPPDKPEAFAATGSYADVLDEAAKEWLDQAAALVPEDVTVRTHVAVDENSADGILKEIDRLDSTMLVVGGSGGGLIGRHSLGSVVNDLLHSSPVPVALAPRGFSRTGPQRVREITAAIGRRPGAEILLDTAVELSAQGQIPLRLMSLVSRDDWPPKLSAEEEQQAVERGMELAGRALDEARSRLPEGTGLDSAVAEGRNIEDAVLTVDWHDGDVIMVGSSRLAAPRKLFLGSTAAKMLRVLAVPMIVVPRQAQS
ncbi:universal stress protein [Gordonia sp. ABSL11-1]|uniref:universal stress protein n=1 Tax=Gordonia sp. ABSL11-1 TaxID=3053924 RepID=UPI0025728378|nr:universal stress protein [Gordonia sp. ABSL11-1]MDL9944504.1 universal stress protein [Gordonia sp. ABSL11-1]